ncbi:MAG: hypothetical protein OHK93_006901 [Ramalina farinacea]|uniref:Sin3-associated polypeptide Sap18 n=1 Tax=Ramalina farinacea TaxID=258253 RepID=A0AA43QMD1_9LECA|nr:hypothetical protein [Ramalina farinacea]
MAMQTSPTGTLDRQTVVPFHLKLFYRTGGFHSLTDFPTSTTTNPPTPLPRHLQIYTWPTCTLRELSHLLVSALPSLLPSPAVGTRLSYRLIYPSATPASSAPQSNSASYLNPPVRDTGGRYMAKELGNVVIAPEEEEEEGRGDGRLPTASEREVMGAAGGGVMQGRLSGDPERTLQDARFVIGDFVDVAVFAPGRDGVVAAAPPVARVGGGRGGGELGGRRMGRENGVEGSRGEGGMRGGSLGEEGGIRGGGRGGGGVYNGGGGGGGGGGMNGRSREEVPMGEWRRGERLPDGYAGGGGGGGYGRGGGGYGRGRGRGGY